jgi:hypothetical protein
MGQKKEERKIQEWRLIKASEHLTYEIEMLIQSALFYNQPEYECFQREKKHEQNQGLCNCFLESFTLHTRILIAFFYPRSLRDDDIIADDFFRGFDQLFDEWERQRPLKTDVLKEAYEEANKRAAHLTYKRLDDYSWPFASIIFSIGPIIQRFIEYVPKHRVVPDLLQFKDDPRLIG